MYCSQKHNLQRYLFWKTKQDVCVCTQRRDNLHETCAPSVQHYLACAVWLLWLSVRWPMLTIAPGLMGLCARHCGVWPWGCPPQPPDFQAPQEAVVRVQPCRWPQNPLPQASQQSIVGFAGQTQLLATASSSLAELFLLNSARGSSPGQCFLWTVSFSRLAVSFPSPAREPRPTSPWQEAWLPVLRGDPANHSN